MSEWETIEHGGKDTDVLQRIRVEGGWLYRTIILEETRPERWESRVAMCFVPGLPPTASMRQLPA